MFIIVYLCFQNYKHSLEATQLENIINQVEKTKLNVESLRQNHKEFIIAANIQKNKKSNKDNVFAEEISKIALNAKVSKRLQSIDSTQTCTWNKDLVCNKGKTRFKDIIKQYRNA